jgi:UDP-N-acetyl-2-amino-2-deoxyglucuronate dehydrogenase
MGKRFAITGCAGYIAPRHLNAIRDTGNVLVAACDPNDSVGLLDSYSFDISFFKEFERFDRHLEKLKRKGSPIDYLSICSPNYLHDAHIRFALRLGAHAICEKPLVINPWNIDALEEISQEFGKKIYNVLQLRLHPSIQALKEKILSAKTSKKYEIELTYITSRGKWYLNSWKGSVEKSGGLATNIGVHFFDMLLWIFGKSEGCEIHIANERTVAGFLELEKAHVKWFLSIDRNHLPESCRLKNSNTFRSITVDGDEVEFSEGFTDLHTLVYQDILAGGGFYPEDVRPSIQLVHDIRKSSPVGVNIHSHPLIRK